MSEHTPVVAVIPNYNMATYLERLLPQVLSRGYDRVFVLDDASTDNSVDVVGQFGDRVTLVASPKNQGAAANRNQIIGQVSDDTLIHFMDADMDLETPDAAQVVRDLMARYAPLGVGVIGGLVIESDGFQNPYNYGPVFSLRTNLTGALPPLIHRLRNRPQLGKAVTRLSRRGLRKWPKIVEAPHPVETYWVLEGNMVIRAGTFAAVGGYDSNIRENETQDLALSLHKMGVKTYFDPRLKVIHYHVAVRGRRTNRRAESIRYLYRKHGFARYLRDG